MKKNQIVWTIWSVVESLILIAAGILCLLSKEKSNLADYISYLIGGFVGLDGILRIIMFFNGEQSGLESPALIGGFEITIGIVVARLNTALISSVITFIYSLLFVFGALILIMAILKIIKHKSTRVMPILQVIFGSILAALGVVIFWISEFSKDNAANLQTMIIGLILIIAGAVMLVMTLIQSAKAKKNEKKETKINNNERLENKKKPEAIDTKEPLVIEAKEIK